MSRRTIKSITFVRVGKDCGCNCDNCGQYIRNIWTVKFSGGLAVNLGIDCFEKMYKSGSLNNYGIKEFKKLLKRIEKTQDGYARWQNMTYEEHKAKCDELGIKPVYEDKDTAFYGWSFEQYKEWELNEWYGERFKEIDKELARFAKCGFPIPEDTNIKQKGDVER